MSDVTGDLIPLAAVVALSPLTLIAAVMITDNIRRLAFMMGHFLVIAGLLMVFVQLAGLIVGPDESEVQPISGVLLIFLGATLVFLAGQKFATIRQDESSPQLPAWVEKIETLAIWRTMLLGLVLAAVNPKNILIMMSAATIIASDERDFSSYLLLSIVFALLATAVPFGILIGMVVRPEQTIRSITGARTWLIQHNTAVTASILLIIGLNVVGNGIGMF